MARRGLPLIVAALLALLAVAAFAQSTTTSGTPVVDQDEDGVPKGRDCDDADPSVGGATTFYADKDGDGFGSRLAPQRACQAPKGTVADATDCNDSSANAKPGGSEVCDGLDNDCNGKVDDNASDAKTWWADRDADHYGNPAVSMKACRQPVPFVDNDKDCDDVRRSSHDGASEVCDGYDNDCDGSADEDDAVNARTWYADADGDGYGDPGNSRKACAQPGGFLASATDCDDGKGAINPKAAEACDGVDNDCDGKVDEPDATDSKTWYRDSDGDGFGNHLSPTKACGQPSGYVADATDCNDVSASAKPAGEELCDGLDNDCDGKTDEPDATDAKTWYQDKDLDRYGNASVSQKACRQLAGYVADSADCDDVRGAVKPGGTELCNGIDDNCDGSVDEDSAVNAKTWYADSDGDGFGDPGSSKKACAQPGGFLASAGDCDDGKGGINPKAAEVCDSADNDCDGKTDEPDATDSKSWYKDGDGDGFGSKLLGTRACNQPSGYVADATDCNDAASSANPTATEVCDGRDNDCDGSVDEPDASDAKTWYRDADGDRYGDGGNSKKACSTPVGFVSNSDDCDDGKGGVRPGASEMCDGIDNNCDGTVDEDSAINAKTWYADADRDGFGARGQTSRACSQPSGSVADARDCDDGSGAVNPQAPEVCDGADNDCDGKTDEPDATDARTWYADLDADSYGDANATTRGCSAPRGYVADSTDCNPRSGAANPGADERCDGIDDDCDGSVDEDDAVDAKTWYADRDGDHFGDEQNTTRSCKVQTGYLADHSDCNDAAAAAYPGGREVCDGLDNNCDGTVDEPSAIGAPTWYADKDEDDYGDPRATQVACSAPRGYVSDHGDCDDGDGSINPGAPEICDGQDNNCNPGDESGVVTFTATRGAPEDLTAQFSGGAPGKPSVVRLSRPGTLMFCDGTYYTNIDARVTGLTLKSLNGRDVTRLDGGGAGSVLTTDGSVRVEGLTLTGGKNGDSGGGVLVNGGDLSMVNARVTGNEATSFGGGLYAQRGTLKLAHTEISDNKAHSGGGVYAYYAAMVLDDCAVSTNQAVDGAGLYARFSTIDLSGGAVNNNAASSQGGGVQLYGGASLTCRGGADLLSNTALRGAAVHSAEKSELRSEQCSVGADEIYMDGAGAFHPSGSSFTCKLPDGCR